MLVYALAVLLAGHCYATDIVDTLVAENSASALVQLVTKAGLVDALKSSTFTVFAPADIAFARVPQDVLTSLMADTTKLANLLKYHMVSGTIPSSSIRNEETLTTLSGDIVRANVHTHNKIVTVEGANITETDRKADNGVIHFIDEVIMPPEGSTVDIVANDPEFSTLLSAIQKAGIASEFLANPLTAFAPTNDAFARISKDDLDKLLGSTDRLKASGVTINNAKVTDADYSATNGVVHKIDHVLIPLRVSFWLRGSNWGK